MSTTDPAILAAYKQLATAIVLRARADYLDCYQASGYAARRKTREIEEFFLSDYGYLLTGIDGHKILRELRKQAIKKRHLPQDKDWLEE